MSKTIQKNIYKEGASLAVQADITADTPIQYYPLSAIKSISSKFEAGYGTKLNYKHADLAEVTISFYDPSWQEVKFDIQDIANQAGWTPISEVGLNIATADINSWIGAATGSGSSTAGSVVLDTNDALGGNGTHFIDVASGPLTGLAYKYLVVNDAAGAAFSVLNDSGANNMLTTQNYSGKTVTKGLLIRAADGALIEEITVSSGSVIGVE